MVDRYVKFNIGEVDLSKLNVLKGKEIKHIYLDGDSYVDNLIIVADDVEFRISTNHSSETFESWHELEVIDFEAK